jgi:glycosyltransferase involved in cell wall biosynthesis
VIDAAFAIPGDITRPTGGYAYARRVLELLPDFGVQAHRLQLPAGYPHPTDEDIALTRHLFAQLHPDTTALIDGLALGAMPPLLVDDIRSPIVALVHHPLAYETGLTTAQSRQFLAFERHALAHARGVISTSHVTAQLLIREYGVDRKKLTIAEPGTMPALRARGTGSPLQLLCVGAVIPRKGYTVLIEALSHIAHDDWQLAIVGATDHDPRHATEVREAIMRSGLRSRITLTGAVPDRELQRYYARADLFVMPSLFEGYGMVLTEAVARGLPIVCTTGGASAETVAAAGAIKVPPGDAVALADALERMLADNSLRLRLAEESWNLGRSLPRWEDCAKTIAGVLKSIGGRPELSVPK